MKVRSRDPLITDASYDAEYDKAICSLMEQGIHGRYLVGCVANIEPPWSLFNPQLLFIEWEYELEDYERYRRTSF